MEVVDLPDDAIAEEGEVQPLSMEEVRTPSQLRFSLHFPHCG
jgi:hypothetical protein